MGLSILMLRPAYPESIPLKADGGTFVVPVLINGRVTLDFTLDSGAAEVTIPADVFGTLRRTETISKADLLEPGEYELADGSARRGQRFRIRSLRVGNIELRNVVASVTPMQGNLLLGQSFLSRMRTWSVDNQRHMLVLNESMASAPISEPVAHEHPPASTSQQEQTSPSTANNEALMKDCLTKVHAAYPNASDNKVKAWCDMKVEQYLATPQK